MSWFEKIVPSRIKTERRTRSVPEGLWIKCPACDAVLYRAELERNLNVCPKCSHHMRIGARERLRELSRSGADQGDRRHGRCRRIRSNSRTASATRTAWRRRRSTTGESDALVVLAGHAARRADGGLRVRVPLSRRLDGLGGRRALQARGRPLHRAALRLVCFSASGGARMQEALLFADADGQDQRRAGAVGARRGCRSSR